MIQVGADGKRAAGRFLLAVFALGISAALPAKVVGEEDRSPLTRENEARFAAVGRVTCVDPVTGARGGTTATLVGDDRTAIGVGHFSRLIAVGQVRFADIGDCRFVLYGADRRPVFSTAIDTVRTALPAERYRTARATIADWAVFRLSQPVPAAIRPLRLRMIDRKELSDLPVFLIGYHGAPHIPRNEKVHSPDCAPTPAGPSRRFFRHQCDTSVGSSGALLFVETEDGPRGIGINNASDDQSPWNYGQFITPDLAEILPPGSVD